MWKCANILSYEAVRHIWLCNRSFLFSLYMYCIRKMSYADNFDNFLRRQAVAFASSFHNHLKTRVFFAIFQTNSVGWFYALILAYFLKSTGRLSSCVFVLCLQEALPQNNKNIENYSITIFWTNSRSCPNQALSDKTPFRIVSPELEFLKSLWGPGTEEEEGYRTGPPGYYRLAEFIPWNWFRGPIHV
jgi:hypothetical protein